MIIDKQTLMSDQQAVTVTAGSTNVLDLGNDHAKVQPLNEKGMLEILCQVSEAFVGGTSVQASLESDDDVAFGSPTTILSTAVIATAALVLGYQFRFGSLPRIHEQYIRVKYTVVGTFTAGKINAALVLDKQTANT